MLQSITKTIAQQQTLTLIQCQTFGFSNLRKRLGLFSFKLTKNRVYKNPHAMTLRKRMDLGKQGYEGELKMREAERLSEKPYGTHTKKGRFVVDIEKVPFFNIPDLTSFNLKPYVSHSTAKIDPTVFETRQVKLTPELLNKIEETIRNTPKASMTINQEETKVVNNQSLWIRNH